MLIVNVENMLSIINLISEYERHGEDMDVKPIGGSRSYYYVKDKGIIRIEIRGLQQKVIK